MLKKLVDWNSFNNLQQAIVPAYTFHKIHGIFSTRLLHSTSQVKLIIKRNREVHGNTMTSKFAIKSFPNLEMLAAGPNPELCQKAQCKSIQQDWSKSHVVSSAKNLGKVNKHGQQ